MQPGKPQNRRRGREREMGTCAMKPFLAGEVSTHVTQPDALSGFLRAG